MQQPDAIEARFYHPYSDNEFSGVAESSQMTTHSATMLERSRATDWGSAAACNRPNMAEKPLNRCSTGASPDDKEELMSSASANLGAVIDDVQLTPTLHDVSVSRLRKRLLGENDFSSHTIIPTSKDAIRIVDDTIKAAEVEISTQDTSSQDTKAVDSVRDRMLPRTQEIIEHPTRQLNPEQIADLIERGSEFLALGDMNSARLLFERAAAARDPKAAFALAATYDPIALPELGIHVPAADLGRARDWYHKALELGSPGAARRLELLASWRG